MLEIVGLLAVATPAMFADVTGLVQGVLPNDQACWIDVDQDGWTDLITGGIVWRNEKGRQFVKVAEGVGSVVAADMDNDGFPDLYSWTQTRIYRNEAGKHFSPITMPPLEPTVSRGACWGDFNNDGFVDLYVGGYEDWDKDITYPSYILLNLRGTGFGLAWTSSKYRTRGVTACDFNRDGKLDVYVSNYRLQPNQLWENYGLGLFHDVAPQLNTVATSSGFDGGHSIGAAWGDFDNDGEMDLFAGNFAHVDSRGDQPKSRFLKNLGTAAKYSFKDMGTSGVPYQESYASPAAGDVDNDGKLDLFFTTVYGTASFGKPNFPKFFRNEGDFKFVDRTEGSGADKLPPTYQCAFADIKNDGNLALASGGKLLQSTNVHRKWIEVTLEGDGITVNRSAIGAQVRITTPSGILTRQVEAGTGEGNQNDLRLHFGLGAQRKRVTLEVTWPGGRREVFEDLAVNRRHKLRYSPTTNN